MKDRNKHVNISSSILLLVFALWGVGIVIQLFSVSFIEGNRYRALANRFTIKTFKVKANRGNIFSEDEQLLAITVPLYTIHFDPMVIRSDQEFYKKLPALAKGLAKYTDKKDYNYWYKKLKTARKNKRRYVPIAKNISFTDFQKIKSLPLFERGRYKGGFIYEISPARKYPFGNILKRTIGSSTVINKYGLEGAYDQILKGRDGERLKQKINSRSWKPLNDFNEREPENGLDLVTTINMQMQDIAHHALEKQLKKYKADHGVLILMEVKTGAVKAIVNLKRMKDGNYREVRNYAVFEGFEPGSLFKTFTFLALLEDNRIDTSKTYFLENNRWKYYDMNITDAHRVHNETYSVSDAFAKSSNIITVRMVDENYRKHPEDFVDRLISDFGLGKKLNLEITGEFKPLIPHPSDKAWEVYRLGMMSFGYGVKLSPIQILTFYNGIANNGKVMKPFFVKEIRKNDQVVKTIKPEVINSSLANSQNIKIIQNLLRQVVERGTATSINSPYVKIAGKTGTTQTEYWTKNIQYIASFAGYFPYENPQYSMIVVVHKPDKSMGYYGSEVAGKVFQEVAEQVYGITPRKLIVKIP